MELLMSRVPEADPTAEALEIQALVRETLAGDRRAFEGLVSRYEGRVMRLSIRFLRDTDEARDATQEVFLRAFRYVHRLDTGRPVEPWLMRITVNVCRDIQRKRQRRYPTFSEIPLAAENEPRGVFDDPFSGLAFEQQRKMLWKALDGLPEKERMAVILRDVEGFSTSEVSEILGSSEGTVRSQICRGRVKIKEAMDQMMGGQP